MTNPLPNNLFGKIADHGPTPVHTDNGLGSMSDDPPVVARPLPPYSFHASHALEGVIQQWNVAANQRLKNVDVYGVPRVFDLFTLMAITLAFALLFALLKLISPAFNISATTLTVIISGYVTLIAMAQMFLYGGNNPRMASVVAGPFAMLAMCLAFWVPSNGLGIFVTLFLSMFLSIFFGFFFGYLSGAVVAGVLLVADGFRGRSIMAMRPAIKTDRDVSFDEIE